MISAEEAAGPALIADIGGFLSLALQLQPPSWNILVLDINSLGRVLFTLPPLEQRIADRTEPWGMPTTCR